MRAFLLSAFLLCSSHNELRPRVDQGRSRSSNRHPKRSPPEIRTALMARLSNSGRAGPYDRRYLAAKGDSRLRETRWAQRGRTVSVPGRRRVVGVMQFATEGHDYRDQPIAKGVYTMRYGLQPVNGDHLGVSTYRDYSLLLPAAKDQSLALPPRKQLEERSAESAGTSHPAVFLLLAAPPESSKSAGSVIHDAEKNTWSVVLPLALQIKGQTELLRFRSASW